MLETTLVIGYIVLGATIGVLIMLFFNSIKDDPSELQMTSILVLLRRCANIKTTIDVTEVRRRSKNLLKDVFNEEWEA